MTPPPNETTRHLDERPAPTFGNYLRAARLGFHWFAPLRMFIRMSDHGPNILIELCQANRLPSRQGKAKVTAEHRCWWGGKELSANLLDLVPALRRFNVSGQPRGWIVVDDDGEEAGTDEVT